MKKRLAMKIFGVLMGAHGCALLFLMLFAALTVNADSNGKLPVYFGFAAIALGSIVCGVLSAKADVGAVGALIAGILYSATLSAVSFIFGGEGGYSPLTKLGIFVAVALVSTVISLIPAKRSGKGYGHKKKRSALNKYINGR